MSTNVKTKKYDMLEKQNGVALLIHDFGGDGNLTGEYSITLNGTCSVVKDGKREEKEKVAFLHLYHYVLQIL